MRMRGFDSARGLKPSQPPAPVSTSTPIPTPTPTPSAPASAAIPPVALPAHKNEASKKEAPPPVDIKSEFRPSSSAPPKPNSNRNISGASSTSAAAREAMRPPKYGGYSKRDQLGSVNDSWGAAEGTPRLGLFQIEPEPPSPPASPFPGSGHGW